MTTFEIGRQAEAAAASFLARKGCTVLQQNWRNRWCEIDIVAYRENIVYFCEVKYRLHNRQGSGIDYITPQKMRQMQFAATNWLSRYDWQGESQLCAIEVSGPTFQITAAIKDI